MTKKKIYEKVGKRYHEIGEDFTGFPANGIWIVRDGSQNCIALINEIGHIPKSFVPVGQFINECAEHIVKEVNKMGAYSIHDVSRIAAIFYAHKIDEVLEKDKK